MPRREKLEIINEILRLCVIPSLKTRIVYECNLNFKMIIRYLRWCFDNGWLIKEGALYETTQLGKDYLNLIAPTVESLEFITL